MDHEDAREAFRNVFERDPSPHSTQDLAWLDAYRNRTHPMTKQAAWIHVAILVALIIGTPLLSFFVSKPLAAIYGMILFLAFCYAPRHWTQ